MSYLYSLYKLLSIEAGYHGSRKSHDMDFTSVSNALYWKQNLSEKVKGKIGWQGGEGGGVPEYPSEPYSFTCPELGTIVYDTHNSDRLISIFTAGIFDLRIYA